MHILLTNDDGIYADGLYAIYKELKKMGNVSVVAPEGERSSIGHAITLSSPIWYQKISLPHKFNGYAVNGTPSDCVKLAVKVILKTKPDLVVSGINPGPNEGCSVIYSGTIAGAREGALLGIPSIAISLSTFKNHDFIYAAKIATKIAQKIIRTKLPKGIFFNLNVPNKNPSQIKGICITRQNLTPIHTKFHKRKSPNDKTYYWMSGQKPQYKRNLNTDTDALNLGYVTLTPLKCDQTSDEGLELTKEFLTPSGISSLLHRKGIFSS